jgi:sugar lactone lactonase YvrE
VGPDVHLEQLAGGDALGEAPVWDAARHRLIWSDILSRAVYEYGRDGAGRAVLHSAVTAYGLVLNRDGALVCSGPGGLGYLAAGNGLQPAAAGNGLEPAVAGNDLEPAVAGNDLEPAVAGNDLEPAVAGNDLLPLDVPGLPPLVAFNDLCADARGRIYTGSIYWAHDHIARPGDVYLVGPDGASVVDDGISLSNGLGLSPDGRTLYLTDSFARTIFAYTVDPGSGALSGKRVFAAIPAGDGMPDGLAVDADGHVWSALWYAGQLLRLDPDGRPRQRLELPVRQVASLAFGGPDLDELYITTASNPFVSALSPPGYDYGAANQGGPLYRARPGVAGCPKAAAAFGSPTGPDLPGSLLPGPHTPSGRPPRRMKGEAHASSGA